MAMTRIDERYALGSIFALIALIAVLLVTVLVDPLAPEAGSRNARLELSPGKAGKNPQNRELMKGLAGQKLLSVKAGSPEALPDTGDVADVLARKFVRMGYDLEAVGDGKAEVPRVFLARMPGDIDKIPETEKRKRLFFKTVLPLVLQVNEEISGERKRLVSLIAAKKRGDKISPIDRLWLIVMAERYKVRRGDMVAVLKRVDIIPPSLALAQAAEESGWGTSRFVREGNAMFGQWTWSSDAMVPKNRDAGKSHKIKAFDNLLQSVRAYVHNLNTHRAYRRLRARRQQMRQSSEKLDGLKLTGQLTSYSERGDKYVATLRSIIKVNELRRLDDSRLVAGTGA